MKYERRINFKTNTITLGTVRRQCDLDQFFDHTFTRVKKGDRLTKIAKDYDLPRILLHNQLRRFGLLVADIKAGAEF